MTPAEIKAINQRINSLAREVSKLTDRVIKLESENKRLSQSLRDSSRTYVPVNSSPMPASTRNEGESSMGLLNVVETNTIKPF